MTDLPADEDHPADCRCAGCEGIGLGFFTGIATDPPAAVITAAAVDAVDSALLAWLEPWLDAVAHGSTLRSQIRQAAAIAVRDAAPHIAAADPTTENEGFRAYKAGLAAGRAEGAAAERQRIDLAMFGCQDCGKIHERRQRPPDRRHPDEQPGHSWAADDGHAYRPSLNTGSPAGVKLADLLREDTP